MARKEAALEQERADNEEIADDFASQCMYIVHTMFTECTVYILI